MESNQQATNNETQLWWEVQVKGAHGKWTPLSLAYPMQDTAATFDTQEAAQRYADQEIVGDDITYRIQWVRGQSD